MSKNTRPQETLRLKYLDERTAAQKNILGLLGASLVVAFCAITTAFVSAAAQEQVHSVADSDIPKAFTAPTANHDYVKREVMIPMRDGVKLHTVIVLPKGAQDAPILLTRTPYNASKRAASER